MALRERIAARRRTTTALAVAGVLLGTAACGAAASGAGVPAAAGRLPGRAVTVPSAPSAGGTTVPSAAPTPAPAPSASAAPETYTEAELRRLLLTADELPAVFSEDTSTSPGSSGISSPSPRCDALAGLLNEKSTGNATVESDVSFDGGTAAPYLSEDLAAMPSAASAAAYLAAVRDAVGTCDRLRADLDVGSVPLTVASATAPSLGEQHFAMELTASAGSDQVALDVQLVVAGSVLLITTGDDATPEDMAAFTSDAYAKLTGATVPLGGHVKGDARHKRSTGGSGGGGQPA